MNNAGQEDPLRKRYLYKLFPNLWGMVMGLITMGMTPRALGPAAYGDYNYLTNFFFQIVSFFDMGTSIGFFAKISSRQKEPGLITFYFAFLLMLAVTVFLVLFATFFTSLNLLIWPGQTKIFILLAASFGIFTLVSQVLNKLTDAYALTVKAEMAKVIRVTIGTIFTVLLFMLNRLNLFTLFVLQLGILLVIIISFLLIINEKVKIRDLIMFLPKRTIKGYIKEFYKYSHPILAMALFGLVIGLFDRWLLQYFAGSEQQGFYGLSYSIGAYCFLFTSAIQPLLMREFSISHGSGDHERMTSLFRKYIPLFYFITAYFSCFIAINADKVTSIVGGGQYQAAVVPIAIMAFYPIHQTYGQLSSSVLLATERTALYRNIGITMMAIGLAFTYLFIAPARFMGLGLGAIGLAIKMVALQIVGVNVQLYFNSKIINLNFWRYIAHQLVVPAVLVACAFAVRLLLGALFSGKYLLLNFLASGVIYSISVVLLVYCFPMIVGFKKQEVTSLLTEGRRRLAEIRYFR